MDRGVGLVPDDRYREGLVGGLAIAENVIPGWQHDTHPRFPAILGSYPPNGRRRSAEKR